MKKVMRLSVVQFVILSAFRKLKKLTTSQLLKLGGHRFGAHIHVINKFLVHYRIVSKRLNKHEFIYELVSI
jgi:hypothetical protein